MTELQRGAPPEAAAASKAAPPTQPADAHDRKTQALTQASPSITTSIADAIVIKDGALFFLCAPDGRVPMGERHGFGLYYHECRYLSGYDLRIDGAVARGLASDTADGFHAVLVLGNPPLTSQPGLERTHVGVRWDRVLDEVTLTLRERLTFTNYGMEAISFPVSLRFEACFEDIFVVRGLSDEHPGTLHPPRWDGGALVFAYDGADGRARTATIHFSDSPRTEGTSATFDVGIDARGSASLDVVITITEGDASAARTPRITEPLDTLIDRCRHEARDRRAGVTRVRCDSALLDDIVNGAFRDLDMLRASYDGHRYIAAGVPWFTTFYGRDSLLTGYQALAFDRTIAEQSLRTLAAYQGQRDDPWNEEEPGKILHVYHLGELARAGLLPGPAYYGTIDATILFVMLVARHAEWTGSLALFTELQDNVERALAWMDRTAERGPNGYISYDSPTTHNLLNQGWKDSGDAIVTADGAIARPPIAMVEVQAYAYRAWRDAAALFRRAGNESRARELDDRAAAFLERFERDFWWEEEGCYVLALQGDGTPAQVVASNSGHVLWAGATSPERARRVAERLLAPDMFSGWGLRTLSTRERRYDPIGYHLGTVWPHDTALFAGGLRRYELDGDADRVATAVVEVTRHFPHHQLPELFAGHGRDEFETPVRYPVADHPQAWGAGSIPFLLDVWLGLCPEGFDKRLRIVRPILPPVVNWLELHGLRIGDAAVDLRFERAEKGTAVEVLDRQGDIDVLVEPGPA